MAPAKRNQRKNKQIQAKPSETTQTRVKSSKTHRNQANPRETKQYEANPSTTNTECHLVLCLDVFGFHNQATDGKSTLIQTEDI